MAPDGGPVEPSIQGLTYPAGPGWWIAGDDRWYPPPEPAEPPGTVHEVGELKPTWQGTSRWDGASWVLQAGYTGDAAHFGSQPSPAFEAVRAEQNLQYRDRDYLAPPKSVDTGSVRVINLALLAVGVLSLGYCVVVLILHYSGVLIGGYGDLVILSLLAAVPLLAWSYFLVWVHGDLHRPTVGRARGGLGLSDLVAFMSPGAWLPIPVLALAAAGGIFVRSKAEKQAAPSQLGSSPVFFVLIFFAVVLTSMAVAVMFSEVLREREARRHAADASRTPGAARGPLR